MPVSDCRGAGACKIKSNTLVVDAGDAFQGLPISNSTKGEARAEILNQMRMMPWQQETMSLTFGLDEVKNTRKSLKFPLRSSGPAYVNGASFFEASTIVDKIRPWKVMSLL